MRPNTAAIEIAADQIKKGGLVAFPTETVYGLGANALNATAVRRIFKAKNRPADNPLIVHVSDIDMAHEITKRIPERIETVTKKVWPGPITFLLYGSKAVPAIVSADTPKIAIRVPAHPVALALIRAAGVPIAAPSANTSSRPSPTNAQHVMNDLRGRIDLILDGGDTFFGVESTVIDSTSHPYTLLRPGAFSLEEIRKLFHNIRVPRAIRYAKQSKVALVPGMKYRHYAPQKPLFMISKHLLKESSDLIEKARIGVLCSKEVYQECNSKFPHAIILGSENNLYDVARNLFSSFRQLDTFRVNFGLIQTFDEKGIGFAISNRTKKASDQKRINSKRDLLMITNSTG